MSISVGTFHSLELLNRLSENDFPIIFQVYIKIMNMQMG